MTSDEYIEILKAEVETHVNMCTHLVDRLTVVRSQRDKTFRRCQKLTKDNEALKRENQELKDRRFDDEVRRMPT